jgi:hypothetical protein
VQNHTSETRPMRVPHDKSFNDPFAAIGGYPLDGSGFEQEETDSQFGETVESLETGA